ncbi:hypothetical protein ACF3VQ_03140 [Yersinia sp. HM-2024]|uniref:hypothetical protein n=1 Tax=Yersinia sp. HM-2024 TaxID=3344550 RepID=UPI00370D9AC7
MKFIFKNHTHSYSYCLILLLSLILSGCTLPTSNSRNYNGDYIQGNIQSNNKIIPENVKITLSLSQNKASGEKEFTLHEYNFVTQTKSLTIPFRLQLPNELSLSSQPLNISVRVEKEGQLIMMSDKLTPLLRQSSEKLLLTVNDS